MSCSHVIHSISFLELLFDKPYLRCRSSHLEPCNSIDALGSLLQLNASLPWGGHPHLTLLELVFLVQRIPLTACSQIEIRDSRQPLQSERHATRGKLDDERLAPCALRT